MKHLIFIGDASEIPMWSKFLGKSEEELRRWTECEDGYCLRENVFQVELTDEQQKVINQSDQTYVMIGSHKLNVVVIKEEGD